MQNIKNLFLILIAGFCFSSLLSSCSTKKSQETAKDTVNSQDTVSQVVNVYSHRHYETDQQLYDQFTKQTGIKVNVVKAKADQLLQRLEMEGASSPADLLITVDAGSLSRIKAKGLFQPITSELLFSQIPAHLRDSENYWFGLTQRARVIAYHTDKVKPTAFSTYQDLTNPKWKGKILVRASDNIYNQSLLASIIHHEGADKAKTWAAGIVKNMAREPKGGDKDQILALAAGEGEIAIVNTYYVGQMMTSNDQAEKKAVEKIAVFFPNQSQYGSHINISGGGVCKYAPNKNNAIKLLEFLVSDASQELYAKSNQEYPIRNSIAYSPELEKLGKFKADSIDLTLLGKYNAEAVKVFDEVKWK
jgi:iron(III) transport system substrate-binding protein